MCIHSPFTSVGKVKITYRGQPLKLCGMWIKTKNDSFLRIASLNFFLQMHAHSYFDVHKVHTLMVSGGWEGMGKTSEDLPF